MIVCAFETSGTAGGLAILDDARVLADVSFAEGLRHGQALIPSLAAALKGLGLERGAIELFAVGTGPGSYTGLRVGVATAKALAFALKRPVVGASSFDALAAAVPAGLLAGATHIVVAADARRDRVYAGRYDAATRARIGDFAVVSAERLFEGLAGEVVLAGAGLGRYPDLAKRPGVRFVEAHAPAAGVARLGLAAWQAAPAESAAASIHAVRPLYLTPGVAAAD